MCISCEPRFGIMRIAQIKIENWAKKKHQSLSGSSFNYEKLRARV